MTETENQEPGSPGLSPEDGRAIAIAAVAAAPGDTEALAIAWGAVSPQAQEQPEEVLSTVQAMLEILDDAGWYVRPPWEAPDGSDAEHPASADQRLEALRLSNGDLLLADSLARWIASGLLPGGRADALELRAELDAAAEALREWDGNGDEAAPALAHAVRQLLNAAT
jgi:hypothetical protein